MTLLSKESLDSLEPGVCQFCGKKGVVHEALGCGKELAEYGKDSSWPLIEGKERALGVKPPNQIDIERYVGATNVRHFRNALSEAAVQLEDMAHSPEKYSGDPPSVGNLLNCLQELAGEIRVSVGCK